MAPAQERVQTGHQFLQVERLAQIVVGPRLEPVHPLGPGIPRRQHQHRDLIPLRPPAAKHLETALAGQPQVEHDRVVGLRHPAGLRLEPVGGDVDREARLTQPRAQPLTQRRVVLDQ